jgi:dynein intermediate chain
MSDRRAELERKKAKLQAMREEKKRKEEEKKKKEVQFTALYT